MKKIAYFAGGCFWCITPIFKMYKAEKVVCGYSGGNEVNPTYEDVKKQRTGHRETIAIYYDDEVVSYDKLVDIFLCNVDPFDEGGQFIDRGFSYTLAIYYQNEIEKNIAEEKIKKLEVESSKKTYIAIEPYKSFYEAEDYHQDYYLKNPEDFEKELIESGRKADK
ncbi:MAG: peptide-methionine (S)-S-oxide reductase MsrA [Erysipelotrichaceae bacterium]|nr:peptide-methionine (S)-S-oxide reductase MsrA [Erysipelotrichaceae bacterium]